MSKKAIVCVDDEAMIVMSLKQELKSSFGNAFLYETALNAEEALSVVESLVKEGVKVVLIITDWLMPGLNGDEFLRLVSEQHEEIAAIMITGHADQKAMERVKANPSVLAVLEKPWSSRVLRELVSSKAQSA